MGGLQRQIEQLREQCEHLDSYLRGPEGFALDDHAYHDLCVSLTLEEHYLAELEALAHADTRANEPTSYQLSDDNLDNLFIAECCDPDSGELDAR